MTDRINECEKHNKSLLDTVSKKLEIYDFDSYFCKIITCLKTKNTFLCEATYTELEYFHKSYTTAVSKATGDVSRWRIFWF